MVMEPMTKKILAIIPARSGSKGIKNKNIVDLSGKPLISWTIQASLNAKFITKTLVSSDSDEILRIAQAYDATTIKRPKELALDESASESVIAHALESLKGEVFDYIVLLQPTSPLRDSTEINKAFEKLFKTEASALLSVSKIDSKILKAFKENDDKYIEPISNAEYPFMRRQDLPQTFMSNGAIYIIDTQKFLETNTLYTDKTTAYVMDDIKSIDIDTLEDLEKAKNYIHTSET